MNISIDIDKINFNNIFFLEPIKNTVIENSNFIRIIYSNEDIILYQLINILVNLNVIMTMKVIKNLLQILKK